MSSHRTKWLAVVLALALTVVLAVPRIPAAEEKPGKVSASLGFAAPVAEEWTLERCIERALETSATLSALRLNQAIDLIRVSEAKKGWLPTITVSWNFQDNNIKNAFQETGDFASSFFQREVAYQRNLNLNVNQVIYDGGAINSQIRSSRLQQDATRIAQQVAEAEVRLLVKQAYFNILKSDADLVIQQANIEQAKTSLRTAQKRLELGKGTQVEILGEESFLANSEWQALASEQSRDAAERALLLLLNMEPQREAIQVADVAVPTIESLEKAALTSKAFENRPEIIQKRKEIEIRKEAVRALRATRLPTLNFNANVNDTYGYIARREFNFDTRQLEDFSDHFSPFNWEVGLTLRIPITHDIDVTLGHDERFLDSSNAGSGDSINVRVFHPESQKTALHQAKVDVQNSERELQDLMLRISDEVSQSIDEVISTRMRRDANEKALAFSREEHRIQKKRFELGMNTFSELIEARGKDLGAEIELSRSQYDIYLALMNLANKVGVDSVEELLTARSTPVTTQGVPAESQEESTEE